MKNVYTTNFFFYSFHFPDVATNGTLNNAPTVNGGLVLGRGNASPVLDQVSNGQLSLNTALASLNSNPYPNLSTPNSPIMSNGKYNFLGG